MAESFGKLEVRRYSPKRRAVLIASACFAGLLVVYGSFELGRYDAGFRVVDSVRGALETAKRIRELEGENAQQRTQLEAAETARRVDREGYRQVERSLGDMQSQIARLNQDLSFYRGLVQPESVVKVKVQQMQIVPGSAAGQFHLKFVLMQVGKSAGPVAGGLSLSIDGLQQGKPRVVGLGQASAARRDVLPYSFRYFQGYDEPLQLPAGFDPTRVEVEIHAGRDTVHSFRQAFVWKAQGISVETEAQSGDAKGDADVQTESE